MTIAKKFSEVKTLLDEKDILLRFKMENPNISIEHLNRITEKLKQIDEKLNEL